MQQLKGPVLSSRLSAVLLQAVSFAGEQLSLLLEREITLQGTNLRSLRLEELPDFLDDGAEDRDVVGVHLSFSGDADGHVILSFSPDSALRLAAHVMMMDPSEVTEMTDMERSVLGEVGSITAASFLTAVADACRLVLHPSPPTVVEEMIGALLSKVLGEMAIEAPQAVLLHTVLHLDADQLQGDLMLLPSASACALVEVRLA